MREIVLTPKFKRAFRKFVKRNSQFEPKLIQVLQLMKENVFATQLSTYSLQGKLSGLKACSCGYDCRILFTIEVYQDQTEAIILLDIGTHNDVY